MKNSTRHQASLSTPISVIMPVHNAGSYLSEAVNSILNQSNVTIELLIIDDHSTDEAISQLAPHPQVRVLQNAGKGIVPALNLGIKNASYPLIARMDADDIAHYSRLESQLQYYIDNPSIDIVGATVEIFREDQPLGNGFAIYQSWLNNVLSPNEVKDQFFIECCVAHPTFFMSTKLALSMGGYHDMGWPEDYDFIARAFVKGARIGKPNTPPLLFWRDHSNRLSRTDIAYQKLAFIRCKAFYLAQYLRSKDIDQVAIWGIGPTGLKLHDALIENGITVSRFYDVNPKYKDRKKRGLSITIIDETKDSLVSMDRSELVLIAVSKRGIAAKIGDWFTSQGGLAYQEFLRVS